MTNLGARIGASVKALCIIGLLSGIAFSVIVKGPKTISFWIVWGTAIFILGWVVVGLPLIALGDRIFHVPASLLVGAGGLGGALLTLSPNMIARLADPQMHYAPFSIRELAWPCLAFGIAALNTALYRFFLDIVRPK